MSVLAETSGFDARTGQALADARLKIAIDRTAGTARAKRAAIVGAWPDFAVARERGREIKDHVVENLDHYLAEFERNALASGAVVHWAETAGEACRIVVDICRRAGARSVTRSKSMLGEEIGLPHALEAAGIERVETDLAEHIVQLAGERPSHIIWPAMHKTREEISDLFRQHHADPHREETAEAMAASARRHLRERFLRADVGISGANFLVADTGSVCTVTNEGNAEMTTTPPRIHIATAGIEKLVPTAAHAAMMLRLLVRSATGAALTQYTTFHTGPKRAGDLDGPDEFHIVLVDNGRSRMLADREMRPMLRCIRCGACMNHCPVFNQIGGHAYGGTYPGPMGAVLTPALDGLSTETRDLAHACTLNGRCREVCPVDIPLPTLLKGWRTRSWREGLEPETMRRGLGFWRWAGTHPRLYRLGAALAARALRLVARGRGRLGRLPLLAGAWTRYRDLPVPPAGPTFLEREAERLRRETRP
ncbi:LutB/LldF family L-lactate oxidation iron-sulfur protein [Aureimonas jatrophae]|uniref:L-lactate dehydrogenase complex protein LldF n=1 Tax=Aureimonas jatrophae TaxID=1166073 RepID=A0A1H0D9G9_9HYPH|nr:LutB/LldF family L-lactate oxidation iron-sulfur protein [Aureimonas jatrophae]MBB3951770.1 L-lactate dehydrogenase complex protein LldF [Aureimonas jatrophae]SDN66773.1 L-lactate dehydrogenase complex protein LldF [Aureimonas jatrophae]